MAEDLDIDISPKKKKIQKANRPMKRCSVLLLREMQIKTKMRLSPQTNHNDHH